MIPGCRPFCVYMDTNMDTDKKKPNKIRAFASMSMGSSPTAGILERNRVNKGK